MFEIMPFDRRSYRMSYNPFRELEQMETYVKVIVYFICGKLQDLWKNKGKSISCTKKGTILVPFYYILHKILIASLFRRHFSCSFR